MNLSTHRYADFIKASRGLTGIMLLVSTFFSAWDHEWERASFYVLLLIFLEIQTPK